MMLCSGILVKGIFELWGEATNHDELEEVINAFPDERKSPYLESGTTFRIVIESFGKAINFTDQSQRIQRLSYIPFKVICLCFFYSFIQLRTQIQFILFSI